MNESIQFSLAETSHNARKRRKRRIRETAMNCFSRFLCRRYCLWAFEGSYIFIQLLPDQVKVGFKAGRVS